MMNTLKTSTKNHQDLEALANAISKICVPFMRRGRSWVLIWKSRFPNCKYLIKKVLLIRYTTTAEMPEQFQRVLPNIEELRKVLSNQPTDN